VPGYDRSVAVRRVLWERTDIPGFEWCELARSESGGRFEGVALLAFEGVPYRVAYEIELDSDWRTRRVRVTSDGSGGANGPSGRTSFELTSDGAGRWERDGTVVIEASSAVDVDLGFSPSTNTLPIRRLDVAIGEQREIEVAWVLFPSLEVEHGRQSYERLGERTWRYRSVGFEADLEVDEDGLVERYYEWRAVARA
jgi:hypothetical protein